MGVIQLKRSTSAASVPTAGQLAPGELALNLADRILYFEDNTGTVRSFSLTVSDTQAQLNTKLNSSAYTAADVLSKLLTVDGSGSGLDADLLDGNQASAFALLAGATFTGPIQATRVGVGTAADATNTFAFFGTNILFNSGGSIDATFNKAAAANDASFSFKTGFTAHALMGLLGDNNFSLKVDGGSTTTFIVDGTSGVMNFLTAPTITGNDIWTAGDFDIADYAALTGATFTGGVTAPSFSGDGTNVTNVNATNSANLGGTAASAYALLSGATFTGTVTAPSFSGNGASLTNVNALTIDGSSKSEFAFLTGATFTGDLVIGKSAATIVFGGNTFGGPNGLSFLKDDGTAGVYARFRTTPQALEFEDSSEQDLLVLPSDRASGIDSFAAWDFNSNIVTGVSRLGIGGATPDATNTFAFFGTNLLLNSGSSINMVYNKAAEANDASMTFQTGFTTHALMGLLGTNNWELKVGSSFLSAIVADGTTGEVSFPNTDLTSSAQANSIAAGNTLGLDQQLLAAQGQVGKTVLAVGYSYHQGDAEGSTTHSAQITSLEAGNTVFVYATGADFAAGTAQEGPIFLGKGEIYVIQSVRPGTIITASEGAYGFSQQRNAANMSPMPLLSLALAFKDTFFYGFRNCQTYAPESATDNQGWVHVVNGPVASTIQMRTGAGAVVQGQSNINLDPWEYVRLYTSGNQEYRLTATNPIMACHNARMSTTNPFFYDSRLILPLTNDGITWPRSGFVSALYAGTIVDYFVNDQAQGQFSVTPGTPVDFDGTTGATDQDYEPRGATRVKAFGLISAYSGADSAGLEASPLCPVSTFTQRLALPLHIRNSGDGGNNGIALASPYTGTARLYQWNQGTGSADLVTVNDPSGTPVTEIPLIRRDGTGAEYTATGSFEQNHPASALISTSSDAGAGAHYLIDDFTGGYIEVDVPCTVVFNSEQGESQTQDHTFKGTAGATTPGIFANDDEQLTYGITPESIRAEVRVDTTGLLRKRTVGSGGTETWDLA